jgi:hypothetical protein
MTLSRQDEQQDRLDVLRNDQRLRNQGSTFHQFATSDANEDRGASISNPNVIGAKPSAATQYPAAADWTRDPVPKENQLGVDINEMPTCGEPHELRASVSLGSPSLLSSTQATSGSAPTPLADAGPVLSSRKSYRRA